MATKKKSPSKTSKTFKGRVHTLVESDVFKSVAIASILLNILFLITIFVLTSTDTFDRQFFQATRDKYCQNIGGVQVRAVELGSDKKAVSEWQIDCVGSDFKPYYEEAVIKFNAQTNQ